MFLPTVLVGAGGLVDEMWLENPDEAPVSVILLSSWIQVEPLGQSKRLLDLGVFNAMARCLWEYDRSKFRMPHEQRVGGVTSAVGFHILVNNKHVALVEAKSPSVMNKLGELLTQNAFKMRWQQTTFPSLLTVDRHGGLLGPFLDITLRYLIVVKGVVEASAFDDSQILDTIDEEEVGSSSISDSDSGPGENKVRSGQGPVSPGSFTHKHA